MDHYTFRTDMAEKYGLDEAIILQQIAYWCEKNYVNNRNIHDGEVWAYNSIEAWQKLLPFWTEKQIKTRLSSMAEKGLIIKGNYNKFKFDRTYWYAVKVPELRIVPNGTMESPNRSDPMDQTVQPIPKVIPEVIPNTTSVSKNVLFDEFWELYPRKEKKKGAERVFNRLSQKKQRLAIDDIKSGRFESTDRRFIPQPTSYLNAERWNDEQPTTHQFDPVLAMSV